jgi:hypothetical protein
MDPSDETILASLESSPGFPPRYPYQQVPCILSNKGECHPGEGVRYSYIMLIAGTLHQQGVVADCLLNPRRITSIYLQDIARLAHLLEAPKQLRS